MLSQEFMRLICLFERHAAHSLNKGLTLVVSTILKKSWATREVRVWLTAQWVLYQIFLVPQIFPCRTFLALIK